MLPPIKQSFHLTFIMNYSCLVVVHFVISKSALGTQLSNEEKKLLKQELHSLKMEDISSFMESLPSDFFTIIRTEYEQIL